MLVGEDMHLTLLKDFLCYVLTYIQQIHSESIFVLAVNVFITGRGFGCISVYTSSTLSLYEKENHKRCSVNIW